MNLKELKQKLKDIPDNFLEQLELVRNIEVKLQQIEKVKEENEQR